MRGILPFIFLLPVLVCAQGGIRVPTYNAEMMGKELRLPLGIGFDHDLNERMSILLTARAIFGGFKEEFSVDYRSAYHFADNSSSSFYMGPVIGVRKTLGQGGALTLPMGLRMGVRGGLDRWYGDLYAGFQYRPFLSGTYIQSDNYSWQREVRRLPVGLYAGLDIGFGWEGRRDRR
jgi:hypothetical protein